MRLSLRFAAGIKRASVAALLLTLLLLTAMLLAAAPAAAQGTSIRYVGYGQSIPGEVTSANGTEHLFTGCLGESVSIGVTAEEFAPRLDLYQAGVDEPLESVTAGANGRKAALEDVALPGSGAYLIVVSGRSRGDRGAYTVTLNATGANDVFSNDAVAFLNVGYGEEVAGSIVANDNEAWNFRGCEGDEVHAQIRADGFAPQMELSAPIAELPIATAVAEAGEDQIILDLRRALPDTGYYTLYVAGAGPVDEGDYHLTLELEGTAGPETPEAKLTVISELTPTPTPTSEGGPRGRRGVPTPKAGDTPRATPTPAAIEPTPTFTPTPTPEYTMPGMGEGAFTVIDVSSAGGPINHAAYSPDGSVIASAGEDGVVRAWNIYTGEEIRTLVGHTARANYIAFSPDGNLLASAGDDGTVRLWDENGEQVAALEMPEAHVNSVEFSPDSASLVATTDGDEVVVWDVENETQRFTLPGQTGPSYHALFSPDGSQIATGDSAGVVRLWDAASGELLDSLPVNAGPGSADPILSIAFSSDGNLIVVGGVRGVNDASVQIWDLTSGDPVGEWAGHTEWGSTAAISPDNAYILGAERAEFGHDGPVSATVRIWNRETGKLAVALVGYQASVVAAAYRPDGNEMMTSDGSYLYLWPAQMVDVFAAAFGEAIGVQIPQASSTPALTPTATSTPRPTATPTAAAAATATPTTTPTATELPANPRRTPRATATAKAATATPTRIPTATPTPITAELQIFCTVTSDRLNLRSGPGTNFNPPVTVLVLGDFMVVTGRNADATWLHVDVLDENLAVAESGWVSADFVFCVGNLEDAPVIE